MSPETHIVFTGGTICCDKTLNTSSDTISNIEKFCSRYGAESFSHPMRILSEQATPETWIKLAEHINGINCNNIIVLHGTDTMTYSLNAISMLCKNKKIIFIGAMAPRDCSDEGQSSLKKAINEINSVNDGTYLYFSKSSNDCSIQNYRAEECLQTADGYFKHIKPSEKNFIQKPIISKTTIYLAHPTSEINLKGYDKVLIIPYHSNTFDPRIIKGGARCFCIVSEEMDVNYGSVANLTYEIIKTENYVREFVYQSLTK